MSEQNQDRKTNKTARGLDFTSFAARSRARLQVVFWAFLAGWTLIIALALAEEAVTLKKVRQALALDQARSLIDNDIIYRRWNALHGGVYVPITEKTPPNPYLDVPRRDVETLEGVKLTLINPAYMTRQVHELKKELLGASAHITSRRPINPVNAPDPWEDAALERLEAGEAEMAEFLDLDDRPHLRLIKPLVTVDGCLACHAHQGYEIGDVRGGISVTLSLEPFVAAQARHITLYVIIFAIFLMLGAAGLMGGYLWMRRLEDERDANEEKVRSLYRAVEQSPVSVVIADTKGDIEYVNRAFSEITGYSSGEVLGQNPRVLKSGHHPDEYYRNLWETITSGRVWQGEFLNRKKNGELYWEMATISPVTDAAGTIMHFLAVKEDITARKRGEEALVRAKESAERANQAKSEFLANLSHEFRTPMNGIIGMTELTLDTDLTDEQHEYLTLVKASAESLNRLLNDILDFSKIEAGRLELDPIPFSLRETLDQTMHALAYEAHRKELELALEVQPEVPDEVVADPGRLRQVLLNLLGNAVKFTETGEVLVRVALEEENEDGLLLRFSVTDTGPGIPEDKQKIIFEAFTQADGSITRTHGGTGLGLAISSRLVSLFGGRLWVESSSDRGSTFHFTARFGRPRTPLPWAVPLDSSKLEGLKALIVDDNDTARRILVEVLRGWGVVPTAVPDGPSGLAEVRRAREQGSAFAFVLLDSQMPEMDGFELAGRLRNEPGIPDLPLIMLTSTVRPGDPDRCREVGLTGYLPKPIRQAELLEVVKDALGRPLADVPPAQRSPVTRYNLGNAPRSLKVLVAEDNLVNQKLIRRLLEKDGHRAQLVSNGREAVAAFVEKQYDLVLMDIQMPVMDGLQALTALREMSRAGRRRTPVIAMTAYALKGDRERFLAQGFDGYLAKPLDQAELRRILVELSGAGALGPGA
ncbi:MAG: response regulator, partial [Thermodesulfobacteriota bacterium]